MTKDDVLKLIDAKIAGQGNQVDAGNALRPVLEAILDLIGGGAALPDGGTTGQVLSKLSDGNQDVGWVNPISDKFRYVLDLTNERISVVNLNVSTGDGCVSFYEAAALLGESFNGLALFKGSCRINLPSNNEYNIIKNYGIICMRTPLIFIGDINGTLKFTGTLRGIQGNVSGYIKNAVLRPRTDLAINVEVTTSYIDVELYSLSKQYYAALSILPSDMTTPWEIGGETGSLPISIFRVGNIVTLTGTAKYPNNISTVFNNILKVPQGFRPHNFINYPQRSQQWTGVDGNGVWDYSVLIAPGGDLNIEKFTRGGTEAPYIAGKRLNIGGSWPTTESIDAGIFIR